MCGIAGIVGGNPVSRRTHLEFMTETQRHRGPESGGVFASDALILGHRRLALVDLSPAGGQPMHSKDGRWTLVFNGEIMNHRELRRDLPGPWRGNSDTEVLVEACAHWGLTRALERVVGMFALGLWDRREAELTLVRDRYGEKPLVYFWDSRTLAFASELKALMDLHERRLDPRAVDAYLTLGYIPAPLAAFRHCFKLQPGHLVRFKCRQDDGTTSVLASSSGVQTPTTEKHGLFEFAFEPCGEPRVQRWWFDRERNHSVPGYEWNNERGGSLALTEGPEIAAGLQIWTHQLKTYLGRSIRERLSADVPVALALSGGVDSSVIAAECVRQGARPLALTVKWPAREGRLSRPDSDLVHAREVARWLGIKLEVIEATKQGEGLRSSVEALPAYYDEPFADSSAVGCLALARAIGGRYKAIVNGDGGDEVFAGYRHYEWIGAKQMMKRAAAAMGLADGYGSANVYVQSKALFRSSERRRLLQYLPCVGAVEAVLRDLDPPHAPALRQALWIDCHLQLANALTHKMDIALSAFGIEGRSPFLDHRVVEWARQLPANLLVRGRRKKVLLQMCYGVDLPPQVFDRPKQGFGAPVTEWLAGPLREWAHERVPCPLLEKKAQQNKTGQQLWALAEFSQWAAHWRVTW